MFYENNTNMKNIAVVEIHLSGNQEFIFLKRVTITYTSFISYFVNWILAWFQNFLLICEYPYELGKNRIILVLVIIKYSFRKYPVAKPTIPLVKFSCSVMSDSLRPHRTPGNRSARRAFPLTSVKRAKASSWRATWKSTLDFSGFFVFTLSSGDWKNKTQNNNPSDS